MTSLDTQFESARQSLVERGFAQIDGVFTPADLETVAVQLDRAFARLEARNADLRLSGDRVREVCRALSKERGLRESTVFETARALAARLLGGSARCSFDHAIYKEPGLSTVIDWHQDQAYQRFDRPMRSVHLWIPLQPMDAHMGGLEFIEGSHRYRTLPHLESEGGQTRSVQTHRDWCAAAVQVPFGGLSAHLPNTIHRSVPNASDRTRKAWILHFSPWGRFDLLRPDNVLRWLGVPRRGTHPVEG